MITERYFAFQQPHRPTWAVYDRGKGEVVHGNITRKKAEGTAAAMNEQVRARTHGLPGEARR